MYSLFSVAILVFCCLVCTSMGSLSTSTTTTASIMPWFCLQRCGFNQSEILSQIHDVAALAASGEVAFDVVAFERYNLGANSSLVFNSDLFDINQAIRKNYAKVWKPKRIAMVSSYPYPPQFLSWMRELFAAPEPFIASVRKELEEHKIDGVNIDFEPAGGNATVEDSIQYAAFLRKLKLALAQDGHVVTVAAATWSKVWNISAIAEALRPEPPHMIVGYATMMNTYTYTNKSFNENLEEDIATFTGAPSRGDLVVGMETWPKAKETDAEIKSHFEQLADHGVCRIGLWDTPIPPRWVPHLKAFTKRCNRQ